jgi:hypothetical protein
VSSIKHPQLEEEVGCLVTSTKTETSQDAFLELFLRFFKTGRCVVRFKEPVRKVEQQMGVAFRGRASILMGLSKTSNSHKDGS